MVTRTKIDWCDMTWNPVWGCRTGCEYCYARRIAKRFWKTMYEQEWKYLSENDLLENNTQLTLLEEGLRNFEPTLLLKQLNRKFPKQPCKIFINSMSDIRWWKEEWINTVLERIKLYPQHTFMFLTKFPQVYERHSYPPNCWLGETINSGSTGIYLPITTNISFVSIEPLLAPVNIYSLRLYDWVIIGAQTNPLKLPMRKWVEDIITFCKKHNIPLFMKHNLEGLGIQLIQEFPPARDVEDKKNYR